MILKNKRIFKNTLMLYARQILILLVSLYTVRVVLNVLGVVDYGVYNVVAGIVTFFSFFSGSMASATQRFFSISLGQENVESLKKTFSVNLIIYGAIAFIALILLESIGLWYVEKKLLLPPEKMDSVILIYQFSMLTFLATIFSTPFMAIIIAHEDMQIYAYVSIVEAILKLGVVFFLTFLSCNKLELYAILLFIVSLITTIIYIGISIKKYKECQFRKFYWDKALLIEIIGFTGWTLFGQITTVVRNQAVTVLLNQFFNPVIVSAKVIATNITNQINLFSNNFNVGLYPPIIKAYASNEKEEMYNLIFNGSKITFFLLWVFALPVFWEMDMILNLWLVNPPLGSELFTRLALGEVLINSISLPIMTAARAPGKVRAYELILGSLQISIFIIDWLVLKIGSAAYSIFVVAIIVNIIMFIVRILIVRKLIDFPVIIFLKKVFIPVSIVILISTSVTGFIHMNIPKGLVFSAITIFSSVLISTICMYFFGLNRILRNKVKNVIGLKFQKLTHKILSNS